MVRFYAYGLGYNFDAKQTYFNVADALTKLILSCYSAGPSREFYDAHGITVENSKDMPVRSNLKESWITCKDNAIQLTEVLAKVLRDEKVDFDFDLQALQRDRSDRASIQCRQLKPTSPQSHAKMSKKYF